MRRGVIFGLVAVLAFSLLTASADAKGRQVRVVTLQGKGPFTVTKKDTEVVRFVRQNPDAADVNIEVEGTGLKLQRSAVVTGANGAASDEYEFQVTKTGKVSILFTVKGKPVPEDALIEIAIK